MNRNDFLQKLKELLSNIPENERDEAISFYEDYFDEAGSDNEEKVIKDLESPEKVAETILAGLSEKELETGEYSERGYEDRRFVNKEEISERTKTKYNSNPQSDRNPSSAPNEHKKTASVGKILLIVFLCCLAAPIGIPLIITVLALLFAAAVTVVSVAFAICLVAVTMFCVGIILVIVSFTKLFVAPFAALCLLGAGLIVSGLSIIGGILLLMAAVAVIPALFRGIVSICKMPFRRRETV